MAADISRIRSNPLLDYASVQLQQGRVVLDADFNELVAVLDRRLRAATSDILGRSTVSSTTPDAFKLILAAGSLAIAKGRLYVDGLLAENHGAAADDPAKKLFDPLLAETHFADPTLYSAQPYLPSPSALPTTGRHLVYLDVWDRDLTHLEQPDLIESAVGVETTSRAQTVWQVRVLEPEAGNASCDSPDDDLEGWSTLIAASSGRLTTGTFDVPPEDDPCELPPTGGYRGLENQTYRVEIHDPGALGSTATFKWSRENSSVGSRVASVVAPGELQLQTLGRDDVLRFNTGDWVEIIDDAREFAQRCGEMRKITVNEAAARITYTPGLPADMIPAAFPDTDFPRERNLRIRRWDHKREVLSVGAGGTTSIFQDLDAGTSGVINVPAAGTTLLLENGITVSFSSTDAKGFRAGDYWVFAARTADASVETLTDAPPRGIHHHYARLGLWDVGAGTVTDCRNAWPPSQGEGRDCSCTACVTAESHASGSFTIQDAVNQVRETGGTVCLGPGQYALREPVRLINARSLRIRGQGPATMVVSPGGAFMLQTCIAVAIENLAILSLGRESAVSVRTALGLALRQLLIVVAGADARASAISLQGVIAAASLCDNVIAAQLGVLAIDPAAMAPNEEAPRVTFLLAAALAIDNNVMWCQRQAVTLAGNVLHLMSTRITGNQIANCREVAISALGLGVPGSSMSISRNSINISGSGIRCGVDGMWIESNKLHNSGTSADNARTPAVGIALATGLDRNGADQCQILANQLSGFSQAGVSIGSPTRELIIKLNIIENCGNGVLFSDNADASSVSIENNHLRNIGEGGEARRAMVVGIGVARAEAATIAGNTIRALGVQTLQSALCAAILTIGVSRIRVIGNEVTEVAPPGDFVGIAAGIMLHAPFAQFDVSHNQVQRDATPSTQPSNGAWFAVMTADADEQQPLSRIGTLATVRIDATRVLVLGAGRPHLATVGGVDVTGAAAAEQARGAVLGNVLSARGSASAVELTAAGECLFNDNRVESRGTNRVAAVRLASSIAIINANRVRGGEPSIQVAGAKSVAVLGNVTTGLIDIPGGLQPPWDALNLRA